MEKCVNCGAELDPTWKFCIRCGNAVVRHAVSDIPSAIRSDEADIIPEPKKTDWAMVVGVLLAVGGVALIVLVAIAIFGNR